jgi:hypothetical protein
MHLLQPFYAVKTLGDVFRYPKPLLRKENRPKSIYTHLDRSELNASLEIHLLRLH